jgi:hypothetical protein
MMADLPSSRLSGFDYPFWHLGLDYFIGVKIARSTSKRYCALFTCLHTRSVHIEICHSLEAGACIMAIWTFFSRRGIPRRIVPVKAQTLSVRVQRCELLWHVESRSHP